MAKKHGERKGLSANKELKRKESHSKGKRGKRAKKTAKGSTVKGTT